MGMSFFLENTFNIALYAVIIFITLRSSACKHYKILFSLQLGFFETKAKGDWTPMITEMGNRGWELACMLETPEVTKIGLGNMTFKVLFFFQRRVMLAPPHGGYPSAIPQGMPGPYGPPPAPYAPPLGAQYPMAAQAAGYYPPQGQAAAPLPGAYPNYAPPPYSAAPEPSAPPLPEKQ